MSFRFRGKRRGPRAALIACALIAALLGVAAQSASASCPFGGRIMSEWTTVHEERGVTLCEGREPLLRGGASGYLQVVDLREGAGIQLQARGEWEAGWRWDEVERYLEPQPPPPPIAYNQEPYGLLFKNTAHGWYEAIKGAEEARNEELAQPEPTRLFSATSASFFTDVNNEDAKTTMTLPMETWWGYGSSGMAYKNGCRDAAYRAPKKALEILEPRRVRVTSFREHYHQEDIAPLVEPSEVEWFLNEGYAVGFAPEVRMGESARRTYLGVYDEEVVYIFTSAAEYSNADVAAIMQEIRPGMEVIQLDAGDSTQFYSRYAEVRSSASESERQVPDVIAVYTASE